MYQRIGYVTQLAVFFFQSCHAATNRGLDEARAAGLTVLLGYFSTPGVPGTELLEIQSAVAEYYTVQESSLDIPLYAYARLDVMVREDIADEARSTNELWNNAQVVVESQGYCDRRVEELVSRYSQPSHGIYGRMAGSSPTRQPNSRGAKTG